MSESNSPGQELVKLTAEEEELVRLSELNKGFERDELTIPFLKVLQPLSPYVQEGPQYVDGARPGMFYNTASNQLNDGKAGIVTVVITHQKSFTQWVPRAQGGGLIKDWGDDEGWKQLCEPDQRDVFNPITKEGHNIVKGRSFTIFNIDPVTGAYDPSIMMFAGTQLRTANSWSTLLNSDYMVLSNGKRILAPHFYFTYLLTTELTTNNKGSWHAVRVRQNNKEMKRVKLQDMVNGVSLWEEAKRFQQSLNEGTMRAAPMTAGEHAANDDEIPF
jgi:hypothetical protein